MTWLSLGSQVVYCEQDRLLGLLARWARHLPLTLIAMLPIADYEQTKGTNKMKKRTTNKLADNKMAPRATLPMADEKNKHKSTKKPYGFAVSAQKLFK